MLGLMLLVAMKCCHRVLTLCCLWRHSRCTIIRPPGAIQYCHLIRRSLDCQIQRSAAAWRLRSEQQAVRCGLPVIRQELCVGPEKPCHKPTFYEQVTEVKGFGLCFFLHRAFVFVVVVVLLSLCRMLLSTVFLFALWMSCLEASSVPVGVREEIRCCHLSVGLEGRSRHAVIGTRCRRNG
jgi:hypothetical protein